MERHRTDLDRTMFMVGLLGERLNLRNATDVLRRTVRGNTRMIFMSSRGSIVGSMRLCMIR